MTLDLSPDPNLKELALPWEAQYWYKSKCAWTWAEKFYEDFQLYFGAERKPRDIFRSDVAEFKVWLEKKGRSNTRINRTCEYGSRFFRFMDELELVEKGFNPFEGMIPRRIRVN